MKRAALFLRRGSLPFRRVGTFPCAMRPIEGPRRRGPSGADATCGTPVHRPRCPHPASKARVPSPTGEGKSSLPKGETESPWLSSEGFGIRRGFRVRFPFGETQVRRKSGEPLLLRTAASAPRPSCQGDGPLPMAPSPAGGRIGRTEKEYLLRAGWKRKMLSLHCFP